jgi:four helix bundle protein
MRMVEKFIAFQRAHEAERIVAEITKSWHGAPDLVDRALRAATSVTLNLTEGTTRPRGSADRLRFYRYAWGSAAELEAILDSASHRGLGPPDLLSRARALTSEAARILTVIVHGRHEL